MENNKEKTITLQSFSDMMAVKAMQAKLSEHGIPAFLKDENVLGMDPVGGVEVLIFEKDIQAALKIMNASGKHS